MKSKIEIAPKEYQIDCTYQEAVLYCFLLNINGKTCWRLPTYDEWINTYIFGWYQDREISNNFITKNICPVRDI